MTPLSWNDFPAIWQKELWQRLSERVQTQKMHHAVLISGHSGLGKADFACKLAQYLLCENQQAYQACQNCSSCSLWQNSAHPDLLLIEPEQPSHVIKVDAIRACAEHATLSSHRGQAKVCLILSAEKLNQNAANALLKTLEEPPQKNYFLILTTNQPHLLPETILSRTIQFRLAPPRFEDALAFLKKQNPMEKLEAQKLALHLHANAPLAALEWLEQGLYEKWQRFTESLFDQNLDIIKFSQQWQKDNLATLLDWFYYLGSFVLRAHFAPEELPDLFRSAIQPFQLQIENTERFIHALHQLKTKLSRGTALNPQLLLEHMLIEWQKLVSPSH